MKFLLFLICSFVLFNPVTSYAWEFGEFIPGDVYVYDVCNEYENKSDAISLNDGCNYVTLQVLDMFYINGDDVWLVYVKVVDSDTVNYDDTIFHDTISDIITVDKSFNVKPLYNKELKEYLEDTIFWMPIHAQIFDLNLELGNYISSSPSISLDDDIIITDFTRNYESIQYVLTSGESIEIVIRDDTYLPLSTNVNNGVLSFTFSLVSMHNTLNFGGVTVDDYILPDILLDGDIFDASTETPFVNEEITYNDKLVTDTFTANETIKTPDTSTETPFVNAEITPDVKLVNTDTFTANETIKTPDVYDEGLSPPTPSLSFFDDLSSMFSSFFENMF